MYKFNKRQKIAITAIVLIIFLIIGIYVYYNDNNSESSKNTILEYENVNKYNEKNNTANEDIKKNEIVVHVSGAVNVEGVFFLNEGDRIKDAIEKAGGVKDSGDISQINLAYPLEDGMKVYVPTIGENEETNTNVQDNTNKYVSTSSGIENSSGAKENNTNSNKKVNINTATSSDLETLPGIGTATAQKIISYRNENGKFTNIEDIKNVKGIGDSKFDNIKDLITTK